MSATRRVDAHACALLERRMTTSCDISPTLSYTDESYEVINFKLLQQNPLLFLSVNLFRMLLSY